MWSGTVVLFSVLAVTLATQAIAPLESKPDQFKNQEGCYMSELGKVVPFGKAVPSSKSCVEYRCNQDSVVISGCGAVFAMPPLELIEEKEKPYPECCKKIKNP